MEAISAGYMPSYVLEINEEALALAIVAADQAKKEIRKARSLAKGIPDKELSAKATEMVDKTVDVFGFNEKGDD
jgi:hypothetical protein